MGSKYLENIEEMCKPRKEATYCPHGQSHNQFEKHMEGRLIKSDDKVLAFHPTIRYT